MPLILVIVLIAIPLIGLAIVVGDGHDVEAVTGANPSPPLPYRPDAI